MARLNLLSSSNRFGPAAPPLSPGVPQTEPGEGKIIKDILCQEHLSGGSLAVPTGRGEGEGSRERSEGEKAMEGGRARAQVCFSSVLSPPPRQLPSVFCSISKAAGALSSIRDKLQERLRLPPFLFFPFPFFFFFLR